MGQATKDQHCVSLGSCGRHGEEGSLASHLHGLLDALGGPGVVLGVQVGQEERVYERRFTQSGLAWEQSRD